MKPECLALIENLRLMDDTFMSKCLENAPECIELILRIIIGKKDLKSGMLALKDIARFSGLSLVEVKKLQASMA